MIERRRRYPDMHVYHYAPYEPTALKRLMGLHATREDEVDHLLREERARRPLPVVARRCGSRSRATRSRRSRPSTWPERERRASTDGDDSILDVRASGSTPASSALLDEIERLQRGGLPLDAASCATGCSSGATEASGEFGARSRGGRPEPRRREPSEEADERGRPAAAGAPVDWAPDPEARTERARPSSAALADGAAARLPPPRGEARLVGVLRAPRDVRGGARPSDSEALGGLASRASRRAAGAPSRLARSTRSASRPRSTRISRRAALRATRPTGKGVDGRAGSTTRRRRRSRSGAAASRRDEPLPRALIPGGPYDTRASSAALRRARRRRRRRTGSTGRRATGRARAILTRALPPQVAGHRAGEPLQAGCAEPRGAHASSSPASTTATSSSRARPAPARPTPART